MFSGPFTLKYLVQFLRNVGIKRPKAFFYKVLTFREIELCQYYLCTDKLDVDPQKNMKST